MLINVPMVDTDFFPHKHLKWALARKKYQSLISADSPIFISCILSMASQLLSDFLILYTRLKKARTKFFWEYKCYQSPPKEASRLLWWGIHIKWKEKRVKTSDWYPMPASSWATHRVMVHVAWSGTGTKGDSISLPLHTHRLSLLLPQTLDNLSCSLKGSKFLQSLIIYQFHFSQVVPIIEQCISTMVTK